MRGLGLFCFCFILIFSRDFFVIGFCVLTHNDLSCRSANRVHHVISKCQEVVKLPYYF